MREPDVSVDDIMTAICTAMSGDMPDDDLARVVDTVMTAIVTRPTQREGLPDGHVLTRTGFATAVEVAKIFELTTSEVVTGSYAAGSVAAWVHERLGLMGEAHGVHHALHAAAGAGAGPLRHAIDVANDVMRASLQRTEMMVELIRATGGVR